MINVPVAFHVVRHLPAGRSSLVVNSSKWTAKEELSDALLVAHQIYRQAAIALEVAAYGFADVNSDLTVVDIRNEKSPGWAALRPLGKKSVANIFVVEQVLNNGGTDGSTWDHDCIVDTTSPSRERIRAADRSRIGPRIRNRRACRGRFQGVHAGNQGRPDRFFLRKDSLSDVTDLPEEEGFDAGIQRIIWIVLREGARKIK